MTGEPAPPADHAQDQAENPLRIKNPADRKKEAAAREREELMRRMNEASPVADEEYELPSIDLLLPSDDVNFEAQATEVRRKAKILEKTFLDFGFTVKVVEIETGPVIAQYEVELEAGLRLSKITGLADDLAIALRVPSVRIVAPIPGKNTVGIEVPNEQRQVVRLREVIEEANGKTKKMRIPLFLGKDVSGNALTVDLSTLPHLLIAGRTGTGKSVCLNAIISSILMTRRPDEVRMLMIDPKMVELSGYGRLPHLMHPVVTDMRKAEAILAWAVEKMEERYALLARAGVRHISSYNQLGEEELMERLQPENDEERASIPQQLPFIVIVADEMADLMMTSGKEVEQHIIRLAQKSRAVGIHLILATQKPTVDVITGPDQVEPAGANRVPGRQPHRQPRGARRNGGRQAAGQRRHAVPLAGHEHAAPRAGDVSQRRRDQPDRRLLQPRRAELRAGAGEYQGEGPGGRGGGGQARRARRSATSCTNRPSIWSSARAAAACRSCSGRWASATAGRPGSSTSWPRTASSANTTAARPARF